MNYRAFWHSYVMDHAHPLNRRLHFIGTALALICLGLAIADENPLVFVVGMFLGYAFAWVGHFFVEKNRPATFENPVLSLAADFHMFGLMCIGRMDREVRRMNLLYS
jgi:hypothetical protein